MSVETINKIAVIGAGNMGGGIAQEFASHGYAVTLIEIDPQNLAKAIESIKTNIQLLIDNDLSPVENVDSVLENIETSTDLQEAVTDVDIVIEAVFEDLDLKRNIFADLDKYCASHTILATNSSVMVPSMLADATQRPEKVIGAHYFYPPFLMPLVEIVKGPQTSAKTANVLNEILTKIGKTPIVMQKEVIGFIANRLEGAFMREAITLVDKGIVSAQDIDTVMKNSIGLRLPTVGPFELYDIQGWDLIAMAAPFLLGDLDTSQDFPEMMKEKLAKGEIGAKAGQGFYSWDQNKIDAVNEKIMVSLIKIAKWRQ